MNPVFLLDSLPPLEKIFSSVNPKIKQALVICDKRFQSHSVLKKWKQKKNLNFYYVKAGEESKSLEKLPLHIKKIITLNKEFDKNSLLFISFGGGSIIDLTGFLASVYKRGLPVVHFPTTWLSALDSAHGGKTALNFQNIKNVLGTYHFPKAVYLIKKILRKNPEKQKQEALGELIKTAFIEGGGFYNKLKKEKKPLSLEKFLSSAIQIKMKIVNKDPFETKSLRQKLNLGHTMGHILEALYPLPHGTAVLQGLLFSLHWSFYRSFINKKDFEEMLSLIPKKKINKKIPFSLLKKNLKQDKKYKKGSKINFLFIRKPGDVFIKPVSEKEFLEEVKRQKWV